MEFREKCWQPNIPNMGISNKKSGNARNLLEYFKCSHNYISLLCASPSVASASCSVKSSRSNMCYAYRIFFGMLPR